MTMTRPSINRARPRIFASRKELLELSAAGADRLRRWPAVVTHSLLYTITGEKRYGEGALEIARATAERPILVGHETFAGELAKIAVAYDHAHDLLTDEDKALFHDYLSRTYDANIPHETPVFFNGYYGYKMYGLGLAAYATWPENPRAEEILTYVHDDLQERAVPGLRLGGLGGGWPVSTTSSLTSCSSARRPGDWRASTTTPWRLSSFTVVWPASSSRRTPTL
jgi:hypothetical protein